MLAFLLFGAMRLPAATGQAACGPAPAAQDWRNAGVGGGPHAARPALRAGSGQELATASLRALAAYGVPDHKISRVTVDITLDGPRVELKLRCGADGVLLTRGTPREPAELLLTLDVREWGSTLDASFTLDLVSDGRVQSGGRERRPRTPAREPAYDAMTAVGRAIEALGGGLAIGRLALDRLEDLAPVREVRLRDLARGGAVRVPREERRVDADTLIWQVRVDPALLPPPPPNPWERVTARKLADLDEQLVYWALSRPITPPNTRRAAPLPARAGKGPAPRQYDAFIKNAHAEAVRRAVVALKADDPAAAEAELRMALRAGQESVTALKGLAAALLAQGQYADVVALVTPARARRLPDTGYALLLARAHLGLRQPAPALKLLEEVRARDPRVADLPFHFGVAYFHADRYAEALPAFTARTIVSPKLREQAKKFADALKTLADL